MNAMWSVVLVVAVFYVTGTQCASGCTGYKMLRKGKLTCQDKKIIVDEHNRLRQQIAQGKVRGQPKAANMIEVVWDDELARTAQNWASHCNEGHDSSRQYKRFVVGQNLARTWTTRAPSSKTDNQPDFPRAIDGWFNEVKKYTFNGKNSGTGHYTQVIWSDTWAVGCGYSYYWDPKRGYTRNYVCNYGPTGNIRGHLPYAVGRHSCSRYGMSNSKNYTGLCLPKGSINRLGSACAKYG